MLLSSLRAEKAFVKWLPGMFPAPSYSHWQQCTVVQEDYFEGNAA
jgi:hypothetical protein